MTRCPVCGFELDDEFSCPRCGTSLPSLARSSNPLDVGSIKESLVTLHCERCGQGDLVLVNDDRDIPRYRCPYCEVYRGEFLRTGKEIYYSTTELRVGQFIETRLKIAGHLFLPLDDHIGHLARKIAEATKIDIKDVERAVEYLIEQRIVRIAHKGDHFEVDLR